MNAPDFTCTPYQNHLLCQCCLEPFPDRSNEIELQRAMLPKQSCSMCFKSFCNLYWGCRKLNVAAGGCKKCLSRFVDLEVDVECLEGLICENQYESKLFSDWLVRENKTVKEVFTECLQKVMLGEFKSERIERNKVLDHVVCLDCGLGLFRDLAYQYRASVPRDQFIDKKLTRPDCFYGKNCRTQKHNLDHAK
jgi:E3 ubiquitin-protein ligase CHFR